MIDRKLARKARELWNVDYLPNELNKRNRRAWLQAVIALGDKWIALRKVGKLERPA